jgi:hypothetical protein
MKKPIKKKEAKVVDPLSVFHHAYHILQADMYLRKNDARLDRQAQALGSIILSTFELELLFKCLILIDKRIPPATHRYDVLFRQLHNKHKRAIERKWETDRMGRLAITSLAKQEGWPTDLPNALVKNANAFERMRYRYEGDSLFYLQALPALVVNVILDEIKPEWKGRPAIQPIDPAR